MRRGRGWRRRWRRYREIREWHGSSRFDTEAFDLAAVNEELAQLQPATGIRRASAADIEAILLLISGPKCAGRVRQFRAAIRSVMASVLNLAEA
jgi:hypothetical protein